MCEKNTSLLNVTQLWHPLQLSKRLKHQHKDEDETTQCKTHKNITLHLHSNNVKQIHICTNLYSKLVRFFCIDVLMSTVNIQTANQTYPMATSVNSTPSVAVSAVPNVPPATQDSQAPVEPKKRGRKKKAPEEKELEKIKKQQTKLWKEEKKSITVESWETFKKINRKKKPF